MGWGARAAVRRGGVLLGVALAALTLGASAVAATPLVRLSTDPFTNASSQHRTEVEPDSYGFGSTMVAAFQVGRFFDGGSSDIGWATSRDGGASWTNGFLNGITSFAGGSFDRASDPAVAYDARHGVWLIESLTLTNLAGSGVVVSRSTDGGLSWGAPVTIATGSSLDKTWIVCDNTAGSAFYGHCYSEWDDHGDGNRIKMSTSVDGGLSWGSALTSGDSAAGLGGQPVVQPNGQVIVPIASSNVSSILSFRSVDGGASWRSTVVVSSVTDHAVAGGLRTEPLPSAEVDGSGRVYVVWQDCRFRTSCSSNDIVIATTTQSGYPTWSPVTRIPIDSTTSTVDHFIPGLAVDASSSGSTARLALAYHYYPTAACDAGTCQLDVGLVSSADGGASWSASSQLAGPMQLGWLASTNQGRMVGDYISTSFVGGVAHPVFAVAAAPSGSVFDEAIYTTGAAPAPGAPTVTLTSMPPSSTTSTSAGFAWTTTGTVTSTTCSLDGAPAAACSSPKSYTSLATGNHTFRVTVSNSTDSASASFSWTIIPTSPTVTLTSMPPSSTTSTSAGFAWTTTGTVTSTTCSLDGAPAVTCSSPTSYAGLTVGGHNFKVTVSNPGGSGSANYSWTVTGTSAPPTVTITSGPPTFTQSRVATFTWTTTGSPTSTTCVLDAVVLASCSSPQTVTVTSGASHRFSVTVSNSAGSATASLRWFVF